MIFEYKDVKIYYEKKGNSENVVLFLHGWEGSTLSFKYFFEKLSQDFTCINLDFPPFGQSSTLKTPFCLYDYFDLVSALLEKENITQFDIVAHSFGGRVALMLASKTNKVKRLVLTGCAGIRIKSLKKFFKIRFYKFLKFLNKLKLFPSSKLKSFGSEDYKKLNDIMRKTFSNIVSFDQRRFLKQINMPTLLVWGENDKETPFYFTKILKKHIKDCETIKFENCSHFAYLEKPKTFLTIVSHFLKN